MRRPQIDGLRALAMFGVLYVHFYDKNPTTEGLRVALFFVVSGFLITHILWSAKERGGQIHILNFYIRRALRLFPALAVLVLFSTVFNIGGFRDSALWHLFQLSNVWFLISETYRPWVVGHLWSLNILEQFYLIWPLVILLLPLRRIYVVTIGLVVVMSFMQADAVEMGLSWWWAELVFCSAPIAFGAFAYLLQRHEPIRAVIRSNWALLASVAVIFSPLVLWDGAGQSASYRVLSMPALATIVVGAFAGYRGPVGWFLASPPAQFFARISYGVYIYHTLAWWLLGSLDPSFYSPGAAPFFVISALTIVLATLSWYLLEEPVSQLKDRFPTATRRDKADDAPLVRDPS